MIRSRQTPIGLAALLAAALGLLGCSVTGGARGCPGAGKCPYAQVTIVGQRASGVLRAPEAIALGPHLEVYVADQYSHVVQRFTRRGRFRASWGSYGRGRGQFGAIGAMAVDAHGNVYTVDSTNNRVERFTASGRFLGEWGSPGGRPGQFRFGGGGGPDRPPGGGIAIGRGHVYVSDSANNRIQRFWLDGSHPKVFGRRGSRPGEFNVPRGLAVTRKHIYVADNDNRRIQVLDLRGRPVLAAGRFGRGPGQFADPYDVAIDRAGDVFVADNNNNRIVRMTAGLRYVTAWSTYDDHGRRPLGYLRALAVTPSGHVYVADTGNNRIVVLNRKGKTVGGWGNLPSGEFIAPVGVSTDRTGAFLVVLKFASLSHLDVFGPDLRFEARWSGRGGPILGKHFFGPTNAAVAPDGSVWVTDRENGLVRHLSPTGHYRGVIGRRPGRRRGLLRNPTGVAVDPRGNVYVADTGNHRIQKFNRHGRALRLFGSGRPGPRQLLHPVAVALDRRGNIYVADVGGYRIVELTRHGAFVRAWGGPGSRHGRFRHPIGLAVDPDGNVFVADRNNNRIQKFDSAGRFLSAWGTRGTGDGQFSQPSGVAVDCRGDVLVADANNNRVQIFTGAAAPAVCVDGRMARHLRG